MKSSEKASGINAGAVDRNKDIDARRLLESFTLFSLMAMGVVGFVPLFLPLCSHLVIPFCLLLMGMWTMLLLRTSEEDLYTRHIVTFRLMGVFVVLSAMSWKPIEIVLAALAMVAVLLQAVFLVLTFYSWSPPEMDTQKAFYGSLFAVCSFTTFVSMLFVMIGFKTWPSNLSLCFSVAAFFFFASASWIGSKVTGSRGKSCDASVFSCSPGQRDVFNQSCGALACLPLVMNTLPSLLSIWFVTTAPDAYSSDLEVAAFFLLVTYLLGAQTWLFHTMSLVTVQFYVRLDGLILIETLSKTYVYDDVVGAHLGPVGDSTKETETCHVYCTELNIQTIVVELSEGRFLHLNPRYPFDFINAITYAIENPIGCNQQARALTKQQFVSDIEMASHTLCETAEATKIG